MSRPPSPRWRWLARGLPCSSRHRRAPEHDRGDAAGQREHQEDHGEQPPPPLARRDGLGFGLLFGEPFVLLPELRDPAFLVFPRAPLEHGPSEHVVEDLIPILLRAGLRWNEANDASIALEALEQ